VRAVVRLAERDAVAAAVVVDGEVDEVVVAAAADVLADEAGGQHAIAPASGYEVGAVVGEDEVAGEQARAARALGDPGRDHRAVLVVVTREEVRHQLAVEPLVQHERPRLHQHVSRKSITRISFCSGESVSALRLFDLRETWIAGSLKPGIS